MPYVPWFDVYYIYNIVTSYHTPLLDSEMEWKEKDENLMQADTLAVTE